MPLQNIPVAVATFAMAYVDWSLHSLRFKIAMVV